MRRSTALSFEHKTADSRRRRNTAALGAALIFFVMAVCTSFAIQAQQPEDKTEATDAGSQPVPAPKETPPPTESKPVEPAPELPPGFKLRPDIPEDMNIEKPLMTDAQEAEISTELKKAVYGSVLRSGVLNRTTSDLISKLARYNVHRMTMPKYRRKMEQLRTQLMRDLRVAAILQNSESDAQRFRQFFLKEVFARTLELLDGNFHVRINAALILSGLNSEEFNQQSKAAAIPYAPALAPLIEIIGSDQQRQGVKIVAVRGIHRMIVASLPTAVQRMDIGAAFVKDLNNPKYHYWYHMRLAEALAKLDIILDRQNRAFIAQILTQIVADRGRHWIVRSEAAKGLGRAKMDDTINISKLVYEIVKLGREMIDAYNKKPGAHYWRHSFTNLYLAFQPLNAEEKSKAYGLLTRDFDELNVVVRGAYRQVVPLTAHVLHAGNREKIQKPLIDEVEKWLRTSVPTSQSVSPNLPPISSDLQAGEPKTAPAR